MRLRLEFGLRLGVRVGVRVVVGVRVRRGSDIKITPEDNPTQPNEGGEGRGEADISNEWCEGGHSKADEDEALHTLSTSFPVKVCPFSTAW